MQFQIENIPFVKGKLNKSDPKAALALDTIKRKGVIDQETAVHTAAAILSEFPEFDMASIGLVLRNDVSQAPEILLQLQENNRVKAANEREAKIARIAAEKMKLDQKEASRISKQAKEQKKAELQAQKEAAQAKQNQSRKNKTVFTVRGSNVDDITTIIPNINKWLASEDSIYLTGGLLARWSESNEGMLVLNENNFGPMLGMKFAFKNVKWTMDGEVDEYLTMCPIDIQRTVLGTAYFHDVRSVDALLRHPVVSPTGEVIGDKKGYYAPNNLLFCDDTELQEVDLDTAYADLFDVFHEFPQTAVPGAFATIFTLLSRVFLPTAPMICMDAPTVSSGKSLLARCCIKIVCGSNVHSRSQESSDEEFDKNLKSFIQSNPGQVLFLDDFDGYIKYNVLKTLLTEPDAYSFRILGTPKSCTAKTNFPIILTGNQIQLSLDLTRRSILINIDTGEESPSHRRLSRTSDQLMEFCVNNRNHLLSCAITVFKDALVNATDKHDTRTMGSFEKWAQVVGRSVVYVTEKLKDQGKLANKISGDVTPDMRKWSQMTGGAADVFHSIYEHMKAKGKRGDKSWRIRDLDVDTLRSLDDLLGIQKDGSDATRGLRMIKQKDIPRSYVEYREDTGEPDESTSRKYILRKLTNCNWRIEEMNGQDLHAVEAF